MKRFSVWPIILFTLVYLGVSSWYAYLELNWEFIFYIAVVVLLGCITLLIHTKHGLSQGLLWGLSIWGLLHMIGGLVPLPTGFEYAGTTPVFYSWWLIPDYLKYDQVIHVYGFGLCTWLCWQLIQPALRIVTVRWSVLALCVLAGMGLGALNEIIEFIAVLVVPETNVGGYTNTGWDLVANAVGCILAAISIRYLRLKS